VAQKSPVKVKTKLRKGDSVEIIAGKDKGKRGKILLINRSKGRIIVEGINYISRHVKSGRNRRNPQGGIIRQEGSIDLSNAMFVHNGKTVRLGYKLEDSGKTSKSGKKILVKKRVARPSGALVD